MSTRPKGGGPANSNSLLRLVGRRLALKRGRSMQTASGAITMRASCCGRYDPCSGGLHVPRLFFPVCSIWPVVWERVRFGDLIPTSLECSNLTRKLRSVGVHVRWPDAGRLAKRCFRGCAARALMPAGGMVAQLPRAGQWRRNVVRFYIDLNKSERRFEG